MTPVRSLKHYNWKGPSKQTIFGLVQTFTLFCISSLTLICVGRGAGIILPTAGFPLITQEQ